MAITSSLNKLSIDQRGGTITIFIKYPSSSFSSPVIVYGMGGINWLSIIQGPTTSSGVQYYVTFTQFNNNIQALYDRNAAIFFYSGSEQLAIPVVQGSGYLPIGLENFYISGSQQDVNYPYVLKIGGKVVFKGVSVPVGANRQPASININRIVENYIHTYMFDEPEWEWQDLGSLTVDFYRIQNGQEVYLRTFYLANDWSGEDKVYNNSKAINDPINGHATDFMNMPLSVYTSIKDTDWTVEFTDKNGWVSYEQLDTPPDAFNVYNALVEDGLSEIAFLKNGNMEFSYDCTYCGDGYFYYINRYGGWDVFLIEGNIHKYDNYNKDYFSKGSESNYSEAWNKITNRVNITTTYDCSTGWMTDEEAERLVFHLLSSPVVYFQKTYKRGENATEPISVNITNSQAEYKKFKNGRNLVRYNITFEESNIKTIKGNE